MKLARSGDKILVRTAGIVTVMFSMCLKTTIQLPKP
ncbi:hypothetical protein RSal33209_2340 [Renibacterium salmoninarum ATCC 33209]|uniref:Uncharacterized protein n=1 Tax=Renibacterium salmoninarum (strain ATCC 33209 / DSM 20767 / JCM 11484 / NBRC 15589 / NCIMB 2235) TaxID=288705 RepID=A9WR60_RENSM|nr:hypothetical protein RSal33209_2340 [Renibacterium salmoninarum ATCC 33209]